MGLIGLNTTPAERMRGAKFADNFFNSAKVAENGGTIFGSPTFDGTGITLNGTTDYIEYAPAGSEFNVPQFSIVMDFFPNFSPDTGATSAFYDSSGSRYLCYLDSGGSLRLLFGGSAVFAISKTVLNPIWREGERNTLVVVAQSSVGPLSTVYLNGVVVATAAGGWTNGSITGIFTGGFNTPAPNFDGKISKFQVYHALLTEEEAVDFYDQTTYDYRQNMTLDLPCDTRYHNPVTNKAQDSTFNGNDATLGDGVTAPLMPTKLSGRRGYEFDGVDDYLSGLTAPTGNFTVSVAKRVSGVVSITQENDLTTWNQLFSSGGFTGDLLSLRVHPTILTDLQEYDEQYWLNERLNVNGLPSGLLSDLISEGALVMYHDYRSGSFRDWSENDNDGTPTGVTWATRAINYPSPTTPKIVVSNASELQTTEGTLVVLCELFNASGTKRLITKRDAGSTQVYWSIKNATTMQFFDGSNFREIPADPLTARYMAVNFASGEKCEGFENGLSIGLYDDVSTIATNTADVWIGNSDITPLALQNCDLKAAMYLNRKLTEEEHTRLYSELYGDEWATETDRSLATDLTGYVNPADPTMKFALDVNNRSGVCADLSAQENTGTPDPGVMNAFTPFGAGAQFRDVNTGIGCGTSDVLNITGALTVSVWSKLGSTPAGTDYIVRRDHYGLFVGTVNYGFIVRDADDLGWTSVLSIGSLDFDKWHMLTGVYDPAAGKLHLYVDGVLNNTVNKTDGSIATSPGAILRIGGAPSDYDGAALLPQIFSEAKDATWVAEQYQLGLNALWQTDFAAQESIANETTGYLSNTPFSIQSGTWKISEDVIDDQPVKAIECVAAGVLSVPVSALNQTPGEGAYGTWDFWINKADPSDALISIVSQNLVSASLGYYVRVDTN
jgi:hypothetical protein